LSSSIPQDLSYCNTQRGDEGGGRPRREERGAGDGMREREETHSSREGKEPVACATVFSS